MKYNIQKEIGKHFLDKAVQLVKERKTFVFVIDNIDWMLKVHDMRSDKQNTSVHAVATSIVFDHVESNELSDKTPTVNLRNVQLRLNAQENVTKFFLERFCATTLNTYIPCLLLPLITLHVGTNMKWLANL